MSAGIRVAPRDIWLLFDTSNGDLGVKNYGWWFGSRSKARAHKRAQNSANPMTAHLAGPYHYRIISKDSCELEFHEYECRYWRIGKSHGPCTCKKLRRRR